MSAMKALVLDGSLAGDSLTPVAAQGLSAALEARAARVELVIPRGLAVAPCAGCFGCWTRTPGECVVADDARDVARSFVRADVVAYVTPVTFGGYSSALKALLDRIILPVLDPRFTVFRGEVHHRRRYRRYPKTIALGTLAAPDPDAERLFAALVARNGLNVHQAAQAAVMTGAADPASARRIAEELLDRAGV